MPFKKEKRGFKSGGKPFGRKPAFGRDRPSYGGSRSSFGGERSFGDRENRTNFGSFKATCESCGNECDLPFKPTSGKPVYCRDCFKKESPKKFDRPERSSGVSAEDIKEINRKLDLIMEALDIE